jgi:hypothetical protein
LGFDVAPGQELALDLCGKFEILFVSTPLALVEMIQAEALERVLLKPIGFDRVFTDFTDTVGPVVDSPQSRVNLRQKLVHVLRGDGLGGSLKACPLFHDPGPEFVKQRGGGSVHKEKFS